MHAVILITFFNVYLWLFNKKMKDVNNLLNFNTKFYILIFYNYLLIV